MMVSTESVSPGFSREGKKVVCAMLTGAHNKYEM
jgi:hypothetical protein